MISRARPKFELSSSAKYSQARRLILHDAHHVCARQTQHFSVVCGRDCYPPHSARDGGNIADPKACNTDMSLGRRGEA